jgi:hypothetical protein
MLAAHQLHQLLADRGAEARAAEAARHRGVGLGERFEDRLRRSGAMPMPVSLHGDVHLLALQLGAQGDAAALGELDRVVEQVGEHLAHAQLVAAQAGRQRRVVMDVDVQALGAGVRRQRRRQFVDQRQQVVVVLFELHRALFQLGGVEDLVEQAQQRTAGAAHGIQVAALVGIQFAVQQHVGEAEDRIHRRADLVAHVGHEAGARGGGLLGFFLRLAQRVFHLAAFGDVEDDAVQPVQLAGVVAHAGAVFPQPAGAAVGVQQAVFDQVRTVFAQRDRDRFGHAHAVGGVDQGAKLRRGAAPRKSRAG